MRMPVYYRNLPVTRKLRLAAMSTVIAALLLACASLLIDDQIQGRDTMRRDLGVQADLLGAGSTAALTFNDPSAAKELLATLDAKPHITAAYLFSAGGKPFASYHREPGLEGAAAPRLSSDGGRFDSQQLTVFKSVFSGGQRIGTVELESDLGELTSALQHFLWAVFVIILGASLVAVFLSSRLQRFILEPIAHLASVARLVSGGKHYGARAVKQSDDDLGQLTDTFNAMLAEIQSRDEALLRHRDQLEHTVAARTEELVKSTSSSWRPKRRPKPPAGPRANSWPI